MNWQKAAMVFILLTEFIRAIEFFGNKVTFRNGDVFSSVVLVFVVATMSAISTFGFYLIAKYAFLGNN